MSEETRDKPGNNPFQERKAADSRKNLELQLQKYEKSQASLEKALIFVGTKLDNMESQNTHKTERKREFLTNQKLKIQAKQDKIDIERAALEMKRVTLKHEQLKVITRALSDELVNQLRITCAEEGEKYIHHSYYGLDENYLEQMIEAVEFLKLRPELPLQISFFYKDLKNIESNQCCRIRVDPLEDFEVKFIPPVERELQEALEIEKVFYLKFIETNTLLEEIKKVNLKYLVIEPIIKIGQNNKSGITPTQNKFLDFMNVENPFGSGSIYWNSIFEETKDIGEICHGKICKLKKQIKEPDFSNFVEKLTILIQAKKDRLPNNFEFNIDLQNVENLKRNLLKIKENSQEIKFFQANKNYQEVRETLSYVHKLISSIAETVRVKRAVGQLESNLLESFYNVEKLPEHDPDSELNSLISQKIRKQQPSQKLGELGPVETENEVNYSLTSHELIKILHKTLVSSKSV